MCKFVTPPTRVDGGLRQRLLNDGLADVGSDEVRDAGAGTVTLLDKFCEEDDDEGGAGETNDEETQTKAPIDIGWLGLHVRKEGHDSLIQGK